MRKFRRSLVSTWIAGLLFFCFDSAAQTDVPVIATSIPPQRYLLRRLLGEDVQILVAIPPGADHEHFEPGIAQMEELSRAGTYVVLDHPLAEFEREWVSRISELRAKKEPLKRISFLAGVKVDPNDMHYWLSPKTMSLVVSQLVPLLKEQFPALASSVEARKEALLKEISRIDFELGKTWAPGRECKFFAYHSAWGYFARDYGLTQLSLEEGGKEPGMMKVMEALSSARSAGIHTIFVEPQMPASSVSAFAEELQAQVKTLDPMAEDWIENLQTASKSIAESCAAHGKVSSK